MGILVFKRVGGETARAAMQYRQWNPSESRTRQFPNPTGLFSMSSAVDGYVGATGVALAYTGASGYPPMLPGRHEMDITDTGRDQAPVVGTKQDAGVPCESRIASDERFQQMKRRMFKRYAKLYERLA